MNVNETALRALLAAAIGVGAGCSSSNKPSTQVLPSIGASGAGVAGVTPIPGAAGKASSTPIIGSGGTSPTSAAGRSGTLPATGTGGVAMTGAGGMGAAGTAMAGAGGTGSAGTGMAGTGGSAGSSGGFIREDAPTMASASAAGKYMVMSYTSGFKPGTQYSAGTIYYPTDADPPFAMDAVVPGFTALQNSIAAWGPFLASHGIVTITIDTNTVTDSPDMRALALMDALASLSAENDRDGSPLKGKLANDRQAVSGWSMGGGGTLIAAAAHPELKAAVSFAAWGPTGGPMDKVPALMFEGTADPLAAGMSEQYYTDAMADKMLFEVNGAGHDVANDPANSGGVIGLYGLSWFKVYLEGDMRYKQFLLLPKPSITAKYMTNVM